MDENISAIISRIRKVGWGSTSGVMVGYLRVNGWTGRGMEVGRSCILMGRSFMVYGKMIKELINRNKS